ncbi:MAG: secondary thiamine-phosphate synthase enzyme YjbQ [Deltaproteobacteria bacterium]|jgi:secondary thiamine-phosphate synthase enzyme|nr:YjbQ family protein [Deltaproteobacteria bacterium]MBW2652835.1 YjbQ family protein [Deltaproteobacteria bacterium]MCK5011275.1 secondary thiamine-phosphate synthase enzyme YjbQ [Deltaproteobacteria bacterium]MCK5188227.1 secondary thiamine-phosphate synthase enzyme YjbQ [Deltaproteobacteria bacterium]MCK5421995.1 secondary thiamine-phosphate synthase enzyme YjbQ [Deltaproteobacteria bacterium]
MNIVHNVISFNTSSETDIIDITSEVEDMVQSSGIENGNLLLFISGSTASLTTIEYESGVINDLKRAIEKIAPQGIQYEHDSRWGDGNGYSHVRAALLGASLNIPVRESRLLLGTWQQIVLLDFDNRPRKRDVQVQILGV